MIIFIEAKMAFVKILQPFLIKTSNKIETDYLFFGVNVYLKPHTHMHNATVKSLNYLEENSTGIHWTAKNKEQMPTNSMTI